MRHATLARFFRALLALLCSLLHACSSVPVLPIPSQDAGADVLEDAPLEVPDALGNNCNGGIGLCRDDAQCKLLDNAVCTFDCAIGPDGQFRCIGAPIDGGAM